VPKAAAALRSIRPLTATDRVRKELAKDLVADIKRYDTQLAANSHQMDLILDEHGTTLRDIPGIGPVLAARILGDTGRASRFPSAAAYANYTGTAPVEVASADSSRHRLSRYGNRSLNLALHTAAVVQIRMSHGAGRRYYDKKIAEGKSPRDAKRCLKRRLADLCWRTMIRDERHSRATCPESIETAA
jgi:transposase